MAYAMVCQIERKANIVNKKLWENFGDRTLRLQVLSGGARDDAQGDFRGPEAGFLSCRVREVQSCLYMYCGSNDACATMRT